MLEELLYYIFKISPKLFLLIQYIALRLDLLKKVICFNILNCKIYSHNLNKHLKNCKKMLKFPNRPLNKYWQK